MTESQKLLLQIIGKYLHFEKKNEQLLTAEFEKIYDEACRHNLVQLLGSVCSFENVEQKNLLLNSTVQVMMHYENQEVFRQQVYAIFEEFGIDYIPLKGSIIKDYYHEPWHRTCGDIDILVRACDIDRAVEILESRIECKKVDKSEHDVVFAHSNGSVLELHYDLHEEECSVDKVWQTAKHEKGHRYKMSDEMFAFCHIAHMAKHFKKSGCGLRPFVDLYIIKNKMMLDETALQMMLEEAKLDKFYFSMITLIDCWFNQKELPADFEMVSDYIFNGGVFGTVENKVAIKRSRMSGFKYFWKRAFVSREGLAYKYPVLDKHPYLYLFCNFHRWYRLVFKGKFNVVKEELLTNASLDNAASKNIEIIYSKIGL